jgi:hypothetical protein
VVIGVLTAGVFATPALAGAGATGATNCVLVADPLRPGEESSHLSRKCADSPDGQIVPASSTLLAIVYANIYMGTPSTPIYGSGGPCDYDGYRINARSANNVVGGISSYRVYNSCIASAIDDGMGHTGGGCGDVNYVGDGINDHVYYMSLWKGC